jgi:transposase
MNAIQCERCSNELDWKHLCKKHNKPVCSNCEACTICLDIEKIEKYITGSGVLVTSKDVILEMVD